MADASRAAVVLDVAALERLRDKGRLEFASHDYLELAVRQLLAERAALRAREAKWKALVTTLRKMMHPSYHPGPIDHDIAALTKDSDG